MTFHDDHQFDDDDYADFVDDFVYVYRPCVDVDDPGELFLGLGDENHLVQITAAGPHFVVDVLVVGIVDDLELDLELVLGDAADVGTRCM